MNDHLTFVHLPLDLQALYRLAARRKWGDQRHFDEGLALHHALGELFGPKSLQPFRPMIAPRKREAAVYAYSALPFEELEQNIHISPPDFSEVFRCSALRHKQLSTQFASGRLLGFDIRLRPIRRVKSERKMGTREMDAYQCAAEKHGDEDGWHKANNRETVYIDWLAERLADAAELIPETTSLAHFRRTRNSRKGTGSEGPDAILHGTLKVTKPAAFAQKLAGGVGRHKSYGYGMILLRPPHRPPLAK